MHRLFTALHTEALRDILEFLFDRDVVKTLANGKLAVNSLLRDVKVLHVEETILANALNECLRELLLALGGAEQAEVQSDEICPVKIFLRNVLSNHVSPRQQLFAKLTFVSGTKS